MNSKRILIVDDDVNVLEMLHASMEFCCPEFDIALASNGFVALEQMNLYSEAAPCDLVLTDYNMPHMNGLELTRVINSSWPETRVVLMSGNHSLIHEQSTELKIDRILKKPFGIEQLKHVLQG